MKFIPSKIGLELLKIRVSKGLSQNCIAQSLLISQKTYSNIEAGKCRLDLIKFLKIAEYTETHPMQFIDRITEGKASWGSNDQKEKELFNEIEKLKAEITFLKSTILFDQNTIIRKLDKMLENHQSLVSLSFFLGFNLISEYVPILINFMPVFE